MILPGWKPLLLGAAAHVPPPQSFKLDGTDDVLTHVWGSSGTLAERRTLTMSFWARSATVGSDSVDFDTACQFISSDNGDYDFWTVRHGDTTSTERTPAIVVGTETQGEIADTVSAVLANAWHHWVFRYDSTQGTQDDRMRFYQNGNLLADSFSEGGIDSDNPLFAFISGNRMEIGGYSDISNFNQFDAAFYELVSGASLEPTAFAYDDGGTWTALHPNTSLTYGNFGFRLDGRNGDFTDASGNGIDFTQSGGVTLDAVNLPPYGAG